MQDISLYWYISEEQQPIPKNLDTNTRDLKQFQRISGRMTRFSDILKAVKDLCRLTVLFNNLAKEDSIVSLIIKNEFLKHIKNNSEKTWRLIVQEIERFAEEAANLNTQIDKLIEKHDMYKNVITHNAVSSLNISYTISISKKSSSKRIADSELLSDGKELEFKQWLSCMIKKLDINADHYLIKKACIAYIESWTKDEATKHLVSRMHANHSEKYIISEKVFDHLKKIYKNSNKL